MTPKSIQTKLGSTISSFVEQSRPWKNKYNFFNVMAKELLKHASILHSGELKVPYIWVLRASPPVFSMWPCTLKLEEEKSTYACLAQENSFSPTYLLSLLRLVKSAAKLCIC
jgi:hypothetical protein